MSVTLVLHFVRFYPYLDKAMDKVIDEVAEQPSLMHP